MTAKPTVQLSDREVSAFAFDLDGTIYLGSQLLPGAEELLDVLTKYNFPIVFATNNSSVSRQECLAKLSRLGLPIGEDQLVTSNDAAISQLKNNHVLDLHLLATPAVEEEYRAAGFRIDATSPDAVLVTFDRSFSYEKAAEATLWLRQGVPFFSTNPDLVCPSSKGFIPDCGAISALLQAATGVVPTVLGKPQPAFAQALAQRCNTSLDMMAFVGDRLYTDVRMANSNQMLSVLTLTGEARADDLDQNADPPAVVVDTLLDLIHLIVQ